MSRPPKAVSGRPLSRAPAGGRRATRWIRRIETDPEAVALFRRFGSTHCPRVPVKRDVALAHLAAAQPGAAQEPDAGSPAPPAAAKPAASAPGAAAPGRGRGRGSGPTSAAAGGRGRGRGRGAGRGVVVCEPSLKKRKLEYLGPSGAGLKGSAGGPGLAAAGGRGGQQADDDWTAVEVTALRWRVTLHGEGNWDEIDDYRLRFRWEPCPLVSLCATLLCISLPQRRGEPDTRLRPPADPRRKWRGNGTASARQTPGSRSGARLPQPGQRDQRRDTASRPSV